MKQQFSWDAHSTRWQLQAVFLEIHRGMLDRYRDALHYEAVFSLRSFLMYCNIILCGRCWISRANLFGNFHHRILSSKNHLSSVPLLCH